MYIEFFSPSYWFTRFALVLKNCSCRYQNNNNANSDNSKTNMLPGSVVRVGTETPGSWVLIPNSTTYCHGPWSSYFPLCTPVSFSNWEE